MREVIGWVALAALGSAPVLLLVGMIWPRLFRTPSGGAIGFLDEVWSPSAAEARAIWETEQELPIPAPSPDRGDAEADLDAGRITIRV